MRRRTLWVNGGLVGMVLIGSTPEPESFRFSYAPEPGHRVTLIFEAEGRLGLDGIPNVRDASAGQYQSMTSLTERVRQALDDGTVLSVIHDSSYAQYSVGGGWVEIPAEWSALGPFRWLRDRRFVSSPISLPADPFFVNVARGLQWTPKIPLPESAVDVGDAWAVDFGFPVTTQIPSDSALLIVVDLRAEGTARLDSLVPRPTDTLAYVTMSSTFVSTRVEQAFSSPTGDLPVTLSGSVSGSYIWSTGWHTWVGNESRVRLEHEIDGLLDARMILTLEATSRIRP